MPRFTTKRFVPVAPRAMYDVVADVARYPEFLPLCESLEIRSRTPTETGAVLVATMTVGYKALRESFTTRVTLEPAAPSILVEYLDGPFHHLENRWRFLPAPGGTEIDVFIDYELRSALHKILMGAVFDRAVHRYAEAFETRARALYGLPQPAPGDGAVTR